MADTMSKRKSKKRIGRKILGFLLILSLIGVALGYSYVDRMLGLIQRPPETQESLSMEEVQKLENQTDPVDTEFTGPVLDPTDVTWVTEPFEVPEKEYITNILLIGQDRRPGESRQRSDAMILCSVNMQTKTLTMTSFLRDLYVQIPGYRDNRLNTAYALGGMDLLCQTLKQNFGVQVDGCIEVDFSQFEKIIDLMGGVDVELTSAEAGHLYYRYGLYLSTGMNHLDGEAALAYSRIRYIGTDFGRTNRQRTVLTALIEQSKNLRLKELRILVQEVLGLITTDMTNDQILDLTLECFPLLNELQVQTQYVPAEGTYQFASIRGMSVIVADMNANRQLLMDTIME